MNNSNEEEKKQVLLCIKSHFNEIDYKALDKLYSSPQGRLIRDTERDLILSQHKPLLITRTFIGSFSLAALTRISWKGMNVYTGRPYSRLPCFLTMAGMSYIGGGIGMYTCKDTILHSILLLPPEASPMGIELRKVVDKYLPDSLYLSHLYNEMELKKSALESNLTDDQATKIEYVKYLCN